MIDSADALAPQINLAHEPSIAVGALTVEPALRRVRHADGREAMLQPRIMQVLVALAQARGAILTRQILTERCWDGVVVGEDAINRVIAQLRRLSEEMGGFEIETVTKVGYRLLAGDAGQAAATAPARRRAETPSICVLPFVNRSGDPEQGYFSDGISDDIVTDLGKVWVTVTVTVVRGGRPKR